MPSDLAAGVLFDVLYLTGVSGLLFLLAWLEPSRRRSSRAIRSRRPSASWPNASLRDRRPGS